MMTLILVALAGYFGFLIGRRYSEGVAEVPDYVPTPGRGIRLRNITIRR